MKELLGLHPRDEHVQNMDDWPLLDLHDATVYSKASGEMHDILDVFDKGPFRITGRLGKVKREWAHVVKLKTIYDKEITLSNVTTWGVERTESETEIKVWALGGAGWYSLHPSKSYRPIFHETIIKGKMWLFLQDKYEGIRSSRKKIAGKAEVLFQEVSEAEPQLGDPATVEELFKTYRRFFMMKMFESRTRYCRIPLYRYYKEEFTADFADVEALYKKFSGTSAEEDDEDDSPNDNDREEGDEEPESPPPPPPVEVPKIRERRGRASKDKSEIIAPKKTNSRVTRSRTTTRSGTPVNKSRPSSKGKSVLRPSTRSTRNNTIASPPGENYDMEDEHSSSNENETSHSRGGTPEPIPMIDLATLDSPIDLDDSSQVPPQRAPVLELFDENSAEAMDHAIDLREEAIKQITNLHRTYEECTEDWVSSYPRYKEEFRKFFEWRRKNNLRPIYVDYICWKSSNEFDIGDDVVLEHIPNTEYLINLKDWRSVESAAEYLQEVNRTAARMQDAQHLQPVRKSRSNMADPPSKAPAKRSAQGRGRGRPARKGGAIKYLRLSIDVAEAKALRLPMAWKCAGISTDGESCNFTIENSTSEEGFKAVAEHWKSCELRKAEAERRFCQKRDLVSEAHKTAVEFQTVDPGANIDNLINWIEAEAKRSSQFPIEQF